jgi:hypothetical protein
LVDLIPGLALKSLETIAARAVQAELKFLLAGGHAVIAHGHTRNTFDLDLIIRREDRESWTNLARALGYNLHHEGPTFLQFNPPDERVLPLDFMFVNSETFAKLMAQAVPGPVGVAGIKVVSLRHLLALKCHAVKHGHAGRIVKDVDDVINLVQVNRLDMDAAEIRELFLKHGTKELYEKVQRACRGN